MPFQQLGETKKKHLKRALTHMLVDQGALREAQNDLHDHHEDTRYELLQERRQAAVELRRELAAATNYLQELKERAALATKAAKGQVAAQQAAAEKAIKEAISGPLEDKNKAAEEPPPAAIQDTSYGVCDACGNAFLVDTVFCRRCGKKKEQAPAKVPEADAILKQIGSRESTAKGSGRDSQRKGSQDGLGGMAMATRGPAGPEPGHGLSSDEDMPPAEIISFDQARLKLRQSLQASQAPPPQPMKASRRSARPETHNLGPPPPRRSQDT
jgi:hypothetical protein